MNYPFYIQKAEELGLIYFDEDGKVNLVNTEKCDKILSTARIIDKLQPTTTAQVEDTTSQEAIVLNQVISSPPKKAKELWSQLRTAFGVGHGEYVSQAIWSDKRFKVISHEIDLIFLGERSVELLEAESLVSSYSSLDPSSRPVPITEFNQCVSQLRDTELIYQYGSPKVEWDTSLDVLKQVRAKTMVAEVLHECRQLSRADTKLSEIFEHMATRATEGIGILRGSIGTGSSSISILESIIGTPGGSQNNWFDIVENTVALKKPASTGIPAFDLDMGGGVNYPEPHQLQGGRLFTIAARTKLGKSTVGVQIATNLAVQGLDVGYVSAELSRSLMEPRILASLSKKLLGGKNMHWKATVDRIGYFTVKEIIQRELQDKAAIQKLLMTLSEKILETGGMIHMDYPVKNDLPTVESNIRLMKAKNPNLRAVILDHFHFLGSHPGAPKDMSAMLEERAYTLNKLCKDCDIDLFLLAQMNQVGLKRDSAHVREERREPQLDEIRGTDCLGHVSHAVWMLRKHKGTGGDQSAVGNLIEVWHSAFRNGQYFWTGDGDQARCNTVNESVEMSLVQFDYSTQSLRSDNTIENIDLLKHRKL